MVKNDILKSRVNPRLKQRLQTYAKIHGYRSTSALVCKVLENFMNEGSKQDENNIILRQIAKELIWNKQNSLSG